MAMNIGLNPGGSQQQTQVPVSAPVGIPSHTWQMLSGQVATEPLPKNLDAMFDVVKGYLNRLKYRTGNYIARAKKVLSYDKQFAALSDADLRAAALDLRALFRTG